MSKIVEAKDLEEGMSLPGLDNGYVTGVEVTPDVRDGTYNTGLGGDGYVLVTFHTADGEEAYLLLPGDVPVAVTT